MRQHHNRKGLLSSTAGLLLAVIAQPAWAQPAPAPEAPVPAQPAPADQASGAPVAAASDPGENSIPDIMITATKRGDEALRNVPIAIQAVTGEALTRSGATQFSEYATRVPSLSFQDLGPGDKKYIIRGINSTGAATVGAYYDEAVISADNRNDGGGRNVDLKLYDIARIEVLKGPQGTLYGASSESGTIRIITNKADSTAFSGYVAGELSQTHKGGTNYNLNGVINLPLVENLLAVRFVGWRVDDSGFIDQIRLPAGRKNNVNTDETSGGRASVRFTPGEAFSLTASATYQKTHSDGSSRYTPEGVQSFSTVGYPPVPGGDLINTDLSRSPLDDKVQIYSLTAEYNFAGGNIVATTNYFDRDMLFNFDSSPILFFFGVPISGITIQPQSRNIWSNELRYASKFDGPLNFVVGGFYSKEKSNFTVNVVKINAFGDPAGPFSGLNSDDALSNPNGNTFFGRYDNNRLEQYAAFGEATFAFTPTLKATVGARYFHSSLNAVQETTHPFGGFGPNPPGVLTNSASDKKMTYKGNLSWKPNNDVLVYATAAQGFRTGGLNQADLPFSSFIPRSYDSDSLWNYELGTKLTMLNGRVRLDGAVYHIDWSDIQVGAVDATGAFPFTTNAGSAKVDGVEADLNALLAHGVTLEVGGSYQHARLSSDQPGATPRPITLGLSGDRLPNVPKFSGSVNLDVDRPIDDRWNYLLHADVSYRGSADTKLRADIDPNNVHLKSYTLVNLRFGLTDREWTVNAFVRNLFDKRAQVDAIFSSQDPLAFITVRPRTFGIGASRKF
jgi:iron complex outermembrane receptor protein